MTLTVAGRYQILELIARGGMAEVFKARLVGPRGFEKIVALKRILPGLSSDREFLTMFVDEAKITTGLTHPNIVQVYELGEDDGSLYIVMEYVDGRNLRSLMDSAGPGGLPVPVVSFVGYEAARALEYAHRKGVVHRDVSPHNLLVSREGEVKLADFGIAKASLRASETSAGMLKGKFAYMSPEQANGLPVDGRTDIFSIGIVLYEALAGRRLFLAETDMATLKRVQEARVPPLSAANPNIPRSLESTIRRALKKNPEARQSSARELAEELSAVLDDIGTHDPRGHLADYWSASEHPERTQTPAEGTTGGTGGREWTRTAVLAGGVSLGSLLLGAGVWFLAPSFMPQGSSGTSRAPVEEAAATPFGTAMTPPTAIPPVEVAPTEVPLPPPPPPVRRSPGEKRREPEGILDIGARPWAEVSVDGNRVLGTTPLKGVKIKRGRHTLRFVNPHLASKEVVVDVGAGDNAPVIVDLTPSTNSGQATSSGR